LESVALPKLLAKFEATPPQLQEVNALAKELFKGKFKPHQYDYLSNALFNLHTDKFVSL
jgi:hypothetical protein